MSGHIRTRGKNKNVLNEPGNNISRTGKREEMTTLSVDDVFPFQTIFFKT